MCQANIIAMAAGRTAAILGSAVRAAEQIEQSKFQSRMARDNRRRQKAAAADALARGEIAAQGGRSEIAQLIGQQRAALAASGIEVDTGSALDITTDTAGLGEFDILNIQANAEREAYKFLIGAHQSEIEKRIADAKRSPFAIGTVILGGFTGPNPAGGGGGNPFQSTPTTTSPPSGTSLGGSSFGSTALTSGGSASLGGAGAGTAGSLGGA